MAKLMHPVFEVYEALDEAIVAVRPRTPKAASAAVEIDVASLQLVRVTQEAGLTLVGFPPGPLDAGKLVSFRDDLAKLTEWLPNDSKVLIDFAGVTACDVAFVDLLTSCRGRLKNRGSRMALVGVGPEALPAFFAPAERRSAPRR